MKVENNGFTGLTQQLYLKFDKWIIKTTVLTGIGWRNKRELSGLHIAWSEILKSDNEKYKDGLI